MLIGGRSRSCVRCGRMIGKDCRGCFLGDVRGVGVEQLSQGFSDRIAGLNWSRTFFSREVFVCVCACVCVRFFVCLIVCLFCRGFDNCSFQVGWYDTRGQGSVDDVGDVGRRTSKFSYSSFVGMGSRSHDWGSLQEFLKQIVRSLV